MLNNTGNIVGSEVVVRFEDTGIGVSAENLSKLFMPFFSRRADGVQGTGLGLPISRSIVERYDGSLEVESELGKGTCFKLRIPQASVEMLIS
jgi:signal transduction histidine kinase